MWLKVQGGFTFSLWLASPAERLSSANDDDSVLVAVVGWHGDVS